MQSARLFRSSEAYCFALVVIGFFMTSLSYLSWFYRLIDFVVADMADLLSMGLAYLFQAVGVGVVSYLEVRRLSIQHSHLVLAVLLLYVLAGFPALTSQRFVVVLVAGYVMALLCGAIAGFYLQELAVYTGENRRSLVFGGGYCVASVLQWLLTSVGIGGLLQAPDVLVVHGVLVLAFAYLLLWETPHSSKTSAAITAASSQTALPENLLPLASLTVVFLSVVNSLGYGFPTTDIIAGVNLELSRVFYALGLLLAGLITDKNRQYGAICCLAACVSPFITLALADGSLSATALWGLDYFFQGFFILFRVMLFADIAARTNKLWLAGFGLMLGRTGEALGTGINALLGNRSTSLITLAALLFVLTVFLFFRLMQALYIPEPVRETSEEQRFENFCTSYGLSGRERQVLRFILNEKSNSEIAAEMYVSEATVKFHVHNLLAKTSCKRRLELRSRYGEFTA